MNIKIFALVLCFCIYSLYIDQVFAQTTPNPATWQTNSAGLKTSNNNENKTAGLGFIIDVSSMMVLRGGVVGDASYTVSGPVGIELGRVQINNSYGSLTGEASTWDHNKLTYNFNGTSLDVWASRLTPALLLQTQANNLTLFTGDVTRVAKSTFVESTGPSVPKFAAYQTSAGMQTVSLTTTATALTGINQNWLLVWYGNNSHFVDTKAPLTYEENIDRQYSYQADAPLLLVFKNNPQSIQQIATGGIKLSFASQAESVSMLPLYGRETWDAGQTDTWYPTLPQPVRDRIAWWFSRLCQFPTGVSETYSYLAASDTTSITENFTYQQVCPSAGTKFAPIPPVVSSVKDILGISLPANISGAQYPLHTEYGQLLGIENVSSYSWSMSGLAAFVSTSRLPIQPQQNNPPQGVVQELTDEVQKIIAAGHMTPWIFQDYIPRGEQRGDMYWANSADTLYHLIEAAEAVSDPTVKQNLTNYIKSERSAYPPEDNTYNGTTDKIVGYNLDFRPGAGTQRGQYSFIKDNTNHYWLAYPWDQRYKDPNNTRVEASFRDVPLYSFYALSRYYSFTGENPATDADLWQSAQETLNRDMAEQDWASFYWFDGFDDRTVAVVNANQHFAGLIGYVRLAQMLGDTQSENLGRALFAKAVVLRTWMAHYPRYLYENNLISLPANSDWLPKYPNYGNYGYLDTYNWTNKYHDARQVARLDQFGIYLQDFSSKSVPTTFSREMKIFPYLTAFRDMTPELARFLTQNPLVKQDVEIYIRNVETLFPQWYVAFAEGNLGSEHNLTHPIDSYQIFMAKSLIQKDTPQNLIRYRDTTWLSDGGDLFYVHKLAETIKAYEGWTWSDGGVGITPPPVTPTPTLKAGDVNGDGEVNLVDLSTLLTNFGKQVTPNTSGDTNGDGSVNLLDLSTLLTNFGTVN